MGFRGIKLLLTLLMFVMVFPVQRAAAQTERDLAQTVPSADLLRQSEYDAITFQPDGWTIGKVVSRKPYTVVVSVDRQSTNAVYKLQVWRGIAERKGDDLLTQWDLLGVNDGGQVVQVSVHNTETIPGYFAAISQVQFQGLSDITHYPWANLPTDPEAKAAQIPLIPSNGMIDTYGVLPSDGTVVLSNISDKVKPLLDMPSQVSAEGIARRDGIQSRSTIIVPSDIAHNKQRSYILDLMRQSIITGFPDHTFRPDNKLTYVEFITMLVRAFHVNMINDTGTGFTKMQGTWAEQDMNIALNSGLIQADTLLAHPNAPITRLVVIHMLDQVMQTMPIVYKPIVNETTFGDDITRADACKMLSLFLASEKIVIN